MTSERKSLVLAAMREAGAKLADCARNMERNQQSWIDALNQLAQAIAVQSAALAAGNSPDDLSSVVVTDAVVVEVCTANGWTPPGP